MDQEAKSSRRRGRYSDEQKKAIIEESNQPGSTVQIVAKKHGISQQLLSNWRTGVSERRQGKRAMKKAMDEMEQGVRIRQLEARVDELEAAYGRKALECEQLRMKLRAGG